MSEVGQPIGVTIMPRKPAQTARPTRAELIELFSLVGFDDVMLAVKMGKTPKTRNRPIDPYPTPQRREIDRKALNREVSNRNVNVDPGKRKHVWKALERFGIADAAYIDAWKAAARAEDWSDEQAAKFEARIVRNNAMKEYARACADTKMVPHIIVEPVAYLDDETAQAQRYLDLSSAARALPEYLSAWLRYKLNAARYSDSDLTELLHLIDDDLQENALRHRLTDMERRLSRGASQVLAFALVGRSLWSAGWVAVRQAVRDARSD